MTAAASDVPEPSAFVRRLPAGERLPTPGDPVTAWETFPFEPFEEELRIEPLLPPVLPEPDRDGEAGPRVLHDLRKPHTDALWADEHWRLDAVGEVRLPAVVLLQPRDHYDLGDLPAARSAELGPLPQRAERAVLAVDGVARVHVNRVHVNRWDGGAHLRFWLLARPAGLAQLRGMFLALWEELLPPVPESERLRAARLIARALAAGGGTAYVG
ncbi:hypothetical protein ACW4TU_02050 [Streptomyces sp. QTS52]